MKAEKQARERREGKKKKVFMFDDGYIKETGRQEAFPNFALES